MRSRRLDVVGTVTPSRRSLLAKGVWRGVAGVVEARASIRALAARFEGEVILLGVANGNFLNFW